MGAGIHRGGEHKTRRNQCSSQPPEPSDWILPEPPISLDVGPPSVLLLPAKGVGSRPGSASHAAGTGPTLARAPGPNSKQGGAETPALCGARVLELGLRPVGSVGLRARPWTPRCPLCRPREVGAQATKEGCTERSISELGQDCASSRREPRIA